MLRTARSNLRESDCSQRGDGHSGLDAGSTPSEMDSCVYHRYHQGRVVPSFVTVGNLWGKFAFGGSPRPTVP